MNKEILDSLATKFAEEWECHPDLNYHSEYGKIHRSYCAGAKEGFALAMEEAKVLVEALEEIEDYWEVNHSQEIAEQALKEFKERSE